MSFGDRIRKLASETAIYGVSSIVGRMLNFILFPFYSQVFRADEYGIVTLVFTTFIFFNIVYQYGMEAAYLRFAAASPDEADRRRTFSTATWSLLGTGLLFSALIVAFKGGVGRVIDLGVSWHFLLYYAAAILLLDALTIVPYAELRLQNRPWRFAAVRIANIAVNVTLNVVLIVGFDMGIEAIFVANAAASATQLVLLLPVYRQGLRLLFDRVRWRELLDFGLPFLPGGLAWVVTERINIFFLKRLPAERVLALYGDDLDAAALATQAEQAARDAALLHPDLLPDQLQLLTDAAADGVYGDHVLGVFGGMMKLAVFMTLATQMFRYAWQPFFLNHANDADARPLFARVFTLFTAAGLLIFLGISFFAQELVAIPLPGGRHLVHPSFWTGLFIVPVALLGYLFQGWYYNFSAGVYIEKKTRYLLHCALVGSAVSLVLNVMLVPQYGMLAAVWAVTAAYVTMAMMLYVLIRRVYPVPYAWGQVLAMGGLAAVLFVAWHQVPRLQVWWAEALMLTAFAALAFAISKGTLHRLRR